MSVEKFNRNFEDLFNWDTSEQPTTEQEYQNAVKNWTQTEMNLVDTVLWQPETAYSVGNIAKTPSLPSQYILVCTEAGDSGVAEPDYTGVSVGDTVVDGTATWLVSTIANGGNIDALTTAVEANTQAIGEHSTAIATNTADIATNAENIATNTEDIANNTTDIEVADKRISNIEKLLQGNLYDYQTDETVAYEKTVPSGAMPYAGIESLGGKTVVMNQLVKNGNFANGATTYWYGQLGSITASDNELTYNVTSIGANYYNNQVVQNGLNVPNGHVIFLHVETYAPYNNGFYFSVRTNNVGQSNVGIANAEITPNTWCAFSKVTTLTNTLTDIAFYWSMNTNYAVGDSVKLRNCYIIDITLMFGAGNEPTTVAEFTAQFPANYYPYNAGTLLSAGVESVKSVGKNLADFSGGAGVPSSTVSSNATPRFFEIGKYVGGIDYVNNYSASAVSVVAGENTLTVTKLLGTYYACGIPFKCVGGENYTISYTAQVTGASAFVGISWYDNSGTRVSGKGGVASSQTETAPSNAVVGLLTLGVNTANIACTYSNIQVEHNATATPYSAPFTATMPIPAEIRNLEGYGWSAGTVYNYIDYERKVFVQNVARVDLGTLTWFMQTPSVGNYFQVNSIKPKMSGNNLNAICPLYTTVNSSSITTNSADKVIGISNATFSSTFRIRDTSYTDVATFKTAMNGVYLYYELAEPIETDISAYLSDDNLISVESGGSLTFPNQHGDDYRIDVPSSETYMVDLQASL